MTTYRYILTPRESALWNRVNSDMRRWGRKRVFAALEKIPEAVAADHLRIFDLDESQIAEGISTDRWQDD